MSTRQRSITLNTQETLRQTMAKPSYPGPSFARAHGLGGVPLPHGEDEDFVLHGMVSYGL